MRNRALFSALAGAALLPALATPALAHDRGYDKGNDREHYVADLEPVPHHPKADSGSDVHGKAHLIEVDGKLHVELYARGLSPSLPHLMHIHGEAEARNECPGKEFREGGVDDRLIETVDGLPAYGPIQITFSTGDADTSADAGLSLDTAPVAKENGKLYYERHLIEVPEELRGELDSLHIVIHGEDLDEDGEYGGEITELGAPLEAELPVACGEIDEKDDNDHHKHGHHHGHKHG